MTLTDRQQRVYDYIRATLEQGVMPSDAGIAEATGIPLSTVTADIARLRSNKLLRTYRRGNLRCFDLLDTKPVEPVRVERHVCPRCQAINCSDHSAAFLTTGHRPAWRLAA